MKGIIADLLTRTHGDDGLARCLQGFAMNVAVAGTSSAFLVGLNRPQMCDEFLPDRFGDRRLVVLDLRQPGA